MTLPSRQVLSVAEAFRLTLDALMRSRNMNGVALTKASGLSSGTVTRMLTGERFASAAVLERLRVAFNVSASRLFDPDAALAEIGLLRRNPDSSSGQPGQSMDRNRTPDPYSASPSSTDDEGGPAVRHEDSELLEALHAYWDQLTPEARLELVGHGMRLRKTTGAKPAFGRG